MTLFAGFLALAALAEAQAQICTHSSTTSYYVCFPYASPAAPSKAGSPKVAAPNSSKNDGAAKDAAFMTLKISPWSTKGASKAPGKNLGGK